MEIGRLAVTVGLAASVLSALLYVSALRGNRRVLHGARAAYVLAAVAVTVCFARLMYLVATKRFEFRYVFDYVSEDLHGLYLYSATWAGQEGSFALWALCTGLIGLVVAWRAHDWEPRVMPVFLTALGALFAVMLWLSPYALVLRETGPRPSDLPPGLAWPPPWPPTDGNGLNPSLQNFWMAIHPPVIFIGFASLAVPFSYAVGALIWRTYDTWSLRVMPWALFTVATLGMGLFMGGYWAYETQGWHGFWAWDPVENAALFPWLGALALAHGLVVQRSRGGMTRTNLFLALAAWLTFVYGTFLTRSGILADFSVHAFGMLDSAALKVLLWMIAIHGVGGLGLLAWRWRGIPRKPLGGTVLSRDSAMAIALILMTAGAVVVTVGTSWPLISRLSVWEAPWVRWIPGVSGLHAPEGVRVEPLFYNRMGTALAIPTLLALGAVPFLAWGKTNVEAFLKRLMLPWLAAIGCGVGILVFVLHEASHGFEADTPRIVTVAIGTLGLFAAFANLVLLRKLLPRNLALTGGWLAHAGVGLMLVGTVITNVYEKTETYAVVEGRGPARTSFGYSLEFVGWTHDGKSEEQAMRDWRRFDHAVKLRVRPLGRGSNRAYEARVAVFKYWNAGKGEWATMTWPHIGKQWHRDVYLAAADDPKLVRPTATLRPGESSTVGVPGLGTTGYEVRYERFYREGGDGPMPGLMGAEMTLTTPEGRRVRIRPGLRFGTAEAPDAANVAIPELGGAVILQGGIDATSKEVTVAFELPDAPAAWVVPIAATNKPMINLVWVGVVLIGAGSLTAMLRRAREGLSEAPGPA